MANLNPDFESSREQALIDKRKIKQKYCPPPISQMKYCIEDMRFHSRTYFISEVKFKRVLRKLQCRFDFESRFRVV